MKESKRIGKIVNGWIAQEDLAPNAGLKVLKSFYPYEGMDENEIEAYLEYRQWYMGKDHALLQTIPKPVIERDFWPEPDDAISFNYGSIDFQRLRGNFNRYAYRLKKVLERVTALAQTHSCLSSNLGKEKIYRRYKDLLYNEFRHKIINLAQTYNRFKNWMDYDKVKAQIKEQYSHISKCEKAWQQHAYQE